MGRPLDIALIGCGSIGSIRAEIAAQNPGVGTIHCFDIRPEAAAGLAERLPKAVSHGSAEAALGADGVRAAIVSTSELRHADPVELALEHGLATLVEKPLVHEPVAALRIAAMAEAAGVELYVGYTQRFRRRYLSAKELVSAGTLGDVSGITAKFFATQSIARKIQARSPGASPSAGIITYLVDLALWYATPALPVRVHARQTTGAAGTSDPEVPATIWTLIELEDGQLVNLGTSWDLPTHHPAYNATISLDVFGTDGFLTVDDTHRDVMVTSNKGTPAPYTPEVVVSTAFIGSHAPGDIVAGRLWGPIRTETNEFLESVGRDEPSRLLAGARQGANVVQVTAAIDAAARSGRPVDLLVDRSGSQPHLRYETDLQEAAL